MRSSARRSGYRVNINQVYDFVQLLRYRRAAGRALAGHVRRAMASSRTRRGVPRLSYTARTMNKTAGKAKNLSRIRRAAPDMRQQALAAARRLIVERPSEALTMRAVAEAAGVTHPNLSHHFGSLAGLHAAVAEELVRELLERLRALGLDVDSTEDDAALVDRVFDMFDKEGLGRILGWLVNSGETARLQPVNELLAGFVEELTRGRSKDKAKAVARDALVLAFAAYAESSVGPLLGSIYKISAAQRRRYFVKVLTALSRLY